MNLFCRLLVFYILLHVPLSAQIPLSGLVTDSASRETLPFVNIGIRHKNIGTTSRADGRFSLTIPQQHERDSLTFSMIGYASRTIAISALNVTPGKTIVLAPRAAELQPVTIATGRLMERKIGIKSDGTLLHFTDGTTNPNDIFEIAQLIRLDTSATKITSLNILLTEPRKEPGTFRINFYGFDGSKPTGRVIEKPVMQTLPIREGWLRFDLEPYGIYVKGDVVVALEFIPTGTAPQGQIYYALKLGGSARSFVRSSSQGEWQVPPHHYRMYVTALVGARGKAARTADMDETDTPPATRMYSKAVGDSFSVFVHTPPGYSAKKKQRYPVVYLPDANVYFDLVARRADELGAKVIIAGIGYRNVFQLDSLRQRDYTYPEAPVADSMVLSGGAPKFLTFLQKELIPYIDSAYRTDTTSRTLMGHSFGAYFTLFALHQELQNGTSFFKNYVAPSPSLEYANSYLPDLFRALPGSGTTGRRLFLAAGGQEDREDGMTGTATTDNLDAFAKLLSEKRFGTIHTTVKIYPAYGHMETALPVFSGALEELFTR